jgi:ribose 5-phosphate isomerase B
MKVILGADHGGFALKQELSEGLRLAGHEVIDVGALRYDQADDYPDFSLAVARAVAKGEGERGIIVCGSGVGASVAANKVRGVRAALCHDTYSARQGVEHDDMNVLCLGGRVVGVALAAELVRAYMEARFTGEERHTRRLKKILAADNKRD